MSSTASPVSHLDQHPEKNELNHEDVYSGDSDTTTNNMTSDSGRLHALEQLEVLPKMLSEGILFAGSGATLLLQAALPGIREETSGGHKALATELIDALQAHISYISCLVFGTRAERKTLMEMLHHGEPPLLGGGRSNRFAQQPALQLWMAATLYATATDFYQRVYGRVDYASAQQAYQEFTLLMNCLGVSELTVSSDAAQFAKDLRESTEMPRWVQSMKPFLRVSTIEMLPPKLRDAYGLRSTVATRAIYRTWMGFSVAVYPAMPNKWRAYPLKFYQDRLREKLNVV
ncbi:uncharacterized protein N7511_011038 [Penicillium nucicola]|uniref:uncharacterized protein n=1 Tax=Penicillium nucicola TaxID=1850975 RepID=UPI002544F634|nr:uncharacterized protein N7511_011038 [Penicillium nucicola]KAJ5749342.1 hypothetical protein N7511_011038 [Penicillium nucicola]